VASVNRLCRETAKVPGRPSLYNEALTEEICERLACGESLRRICGDEGMPDKATVIRWLAKHGTFRARYAHAREVQAHIWVDEIIDLARVEPSRNPVTGAYDPAAAKHLRNQVGTLRWLAMKLRPKRFGVPVAEVDGDWRRCEGEI